MTDKKNIMESVKGLKELKETKRQTVKDKVSDINRQRQEQAARQYPYR